MAVYGYPDLKIELDDSGSTARDISAYVTEFSGWVRERIIEDVTGADAAVDNWADIGILRKGELTLSGPYDDTANSLVAITKGAEGNTRTLKLTFDGASPSDVETCECIIMSVARNPAKDVLTQYVVTLRPTGAIT